MTSTTACPTPRTLFLVLSSRRSFEALVGPVPDDLAERFRFVKAGRRGGIEASLSEARLVVSKNYARPETNRWIFAARRAGIPTLLLVDGPLEWSNLYANPSLAPMADAANGLYEPIVHDAAATIGDAQRDWLAARNAGRGIEFANYANRRILTPTEAPGPDDEPEFDFLLTTAKTACFGDDERRALTALLKTCATALAERGYRVCARLFDGSLRTSVRANAPRACFDTKGTFREALGRARCVIGTPSSVLFEAMVHGRPTALLDFRDRPLFYGCGWRLDRDSDWDSTLDSMHTGDASGMQRQKACLRRHLSHEDFYSIIRRIGHEGLLAGPRSLDPLDLAFERRVHHASRPFARRFYDRFTRIPSGADPAR